MRRSSTPSSALRSRPAFACAGIDCLTSSSSYEKRKHSLRHGTQTGPPQGSHGHIKKTVSTPLGRILRIFAIPTRPAKLAPAASLTRTTLDGGGRYVPHSVEQLRQRTGHMTDTITLNDNIEMNNEQRAARKEFWYKLEGDNFRVLRPKDKPVRFIDENGDHPEIDTDEWDRLPF
jgi:hypothetical protein